MCPPISPHRIAAALLAAFTFFLATGVTADRADAAELVRTWVSSGGDDMNSCSRVAPCKTLTGAMSKTTKGGEINATDPGSYGTATITKAITIDLTGQVGGVTHFGLPGIRVAAGADDDVVLRGLSTRNTGIGSTPCGAGSAPGVVVETARSVRIEDTKIEDGLQGVRVAPSAGSPDVVLDNVEIGDSCTTGVDVEPGTGASADVAIRNSAITNSGTGVRVTSRGRAWITGSLIFANKLGLQTAGTGTIDLFADSRVFGNVDDGAPTRVLGQPRDGAPGTPGTPGTPGMPGPASPAGPKSVAQKLLLAITRDRLTAKRGKRVTLRYLATTDAAATLEVRKGRRVVARVNGPAREGRNAIRWNGKVRGKKAAPGRYTLAVRATSADGQVATASARLRLKR